MSFFLLTNNQTKARRTKKVWFDLYSNAEIKKITESNYLVLTNGFRNKDPYINKAGNNKVFGFGTFFSKEGFHQKAITSKINLFNFDEHTAKQLFGHYAFVIVKNDTVRIVTDPVGLINIFWVEEGDSIYASNDLMQLAACLDHVDISKFGVHEFVINQNTIGSDTLFKNIHRIKLGKEIFFRSNKIKERQLYNYEPADLSFREYCARVGNYFKAISNYDGLIATEVSAGYDTRLVATCASNRIKGLKGICNENSIDFGVDVETAFLVAEKLGIPLKIIERSDKVTFEKVQMLHGHQIGRDVIRSIAMPFFNKDKYESADLILGGYGGEILRGKYCKFEGIDDFVDRYYSGKLFDKMGFGKTRKHIKDLLLNEYQQDWIETSEVLNNWLYAMDRMRIWGGSPIMGKLAHGDRLHPFMDWHLIEPIFGWEFEKYKNGKILNKVIDHFHKDVLNIPVNAIHPVFLKIPYVFHSKWVDKKIFTTLKAIRDLIRKVGYKRKEVNSIESIYAKNNVSDYLINSSGVTFELLNSLNNPDYLSRLMTVQIALDRIKETRVYNTDNL